MYRHAFLALLCGSVVLAVNGCKGPSSAPADDEVPKIPVSHPVEREVTSYVEFTGRAVAYKVVDIKARVTGYLEATPYTEGGEVAKGAVLFEIDPKPYEAQLAQAQSQVDLNRESLKLAKSTLQRDQAIFNAQPGAISLQQLDQEQAAVKEAQARVTASESGLQVYQLNVGFCKVRSPIAGEVSRYYMPVGSLVNQDQSLLTTVVQVDPMYAYFDMDEPNFQRLQRALMEGRITMPQDGNLPVSIGLQGEDGYPHDGVINFVNNQLNAGTGSISVRGLFQNPRVPSAKLVASLVGFLASPSGQGPMQAFVAPASGKLPAGTRLLKSGMFLRVRMPIGEPRKALLVFDRVIQSDQNLKYVYVVDSENKVQQVHVTTGALQEDGMRVVRPVKGEDLKPDSWVVVGALQQVRPRMEIKPDQTPMPSLGTTGSGKRTSGSSSAGDHP